MKPERSEVTSLPSHARPAEVGGRHERLVASSERAQMPRDDESAEVLLRELGSIMAADGGSYYRREEGGLRRSGAFGGTGDLPAFIALRQQEIELYEAVAERKRAILFRSSVWQPRSRHLSYLAFPLFEATGRIGAAIILYNRRWPPFSPADIPVGSMALSLLSRLALERHRASELENAFLRAEREQQAREQRFRALMESAPVAILLIGIDGSLIETNAEARALLAELPGSEQHPRNLYEHSALAATPFASDVVRCFAETRPITSECSCARSSGALLHVTYQLKPVRTDDGPSPQVLAILEDRTTQQLRTSRIGEDQRAAVVDAFAGGVAHEFNNIHQIILGYAELLASKRRASDPGRMEVLEILAASRRATRLVRDLLATSTQVARELHLIDLNELITRVVKELAGVIFRNIKVTTLLDPALPPIAGNEADLRTILYNLATNSRDACRKDGKVEIRTSLLRGDPSLPPSGLPDSPGAGQADEGASERDWIRLRFGDNGEGIEHDVLRRIYDPFFTTKEVGKGRGLGLAVVHGIVKALGGRVECTTMRGRGTTFDIYFPCAKTSA